MKSLGFQFHKGAIRTTYSDPCFSSFAHFNSIKVRLEHTFNFFSPKLNSYFNSIKVRLERSDLAADNLSESQFQFHKGAIRTIKAHFGVTPADKFQFHKGAIRTTTSLYFCYGSFISIP